MNNSFRHLALGLGMIGLFGAAPVVAQRPPAATPIADVIAGAARLDFVPRQNGDGFVLTVSGPDGVIEQKQFEAGRPVMFTLSGPDGVSRRDGIYVYELRARHAPAASALSSPGNETADGRPAEVEASAKARSSSGNSALTGTFRILNGSLLAGGAVEPRAPRGGASSSPVKAGSGRTANAGRTPLDQVIPDDLIVQGSACIGLDCVNGESFGFDTIRLKENNTRIKFEDTSVGTFPTNDWQLTANDSASGAASKFSIEDITGAKVPFTVTAGAASNSIFVDSTGRVGFRTATPVLDLHANTSNTPALRLEQNSSGGFTAQTWDIAGNEANFFVRDVTGGSRLSFRIRPGAPTSSVDISADGDVGIGTGSPSNKLHVTSSASGTTDGKVLISNTSGTSTGRELLELNNNGGAILILKDTSQTPRWSFGTVGTSFVIDNQANAGLEMLLSSTGNMTITGVYSPASSRDVKNSFVALEPSEVLRKVVGMPITSWNYNSDPDTRHIGPMAEDFYSAFAVGVDDKHLSSTDSAGVALAAIQGLNQLVQEKDHQLAELKNQNDQLASRLANLEKMMQELAAKQK